ncbi:efflux RND transporter periplasmic adaptor subunit [Halieaceae bacterium]|nr:efflux RND transporter periplasmic adaptor subunit [Halieaceae bacterium]
MTPTPTALPGAHSRSALWGLVLALAATATITALLYARVGLSDAASAHQPLPVAMTTYEETGGYQRETSFLGLVRAGQRSDLGFEVAGMVNELGVREGYRVAAGEQVARLDTAQVEARRDALAADLERVRAELDLARLKAARQRDLRETGAVSREAVDESRLRASALEAQLKSAQAQLAGIELVLSKSTLFAPYDGVIAERFVNEGAVVAAGTPIMRIVASGVREAHVGIAVEQAARLAEGEGYALLLRGQRVQATLRSIRPDIDPVTLTTTAVFDLPPGTSALDGEPLTLKLSENVAASGGWLPVSALIEGDRGLWNILRLEPTADGMTSVREAVEILHLEGDRAFVRGTLASGQQIVADGVHRVTPGTPVVAELN